jgi:hypothetical protein
MSDLRRNIAEGIYAGRNSLAPKRVPLLDSALVPVLQT